MEEECFGSRKLIFLPGLLENKTMKKSQIEYFVLYLMVIALLPCSSCTKDDPTAPPPLPLPPSTTGSWTGTLEAGGRIGSFTLNLSQDVTRISGSALLGTFALSVSGEAHYPDLQFTCTAASYAPFVFVGTFTSATTISGLVNGSGFVDGIANFTKD